MYVCKYCLDDRIPLGKGDRWLSTHCMDMSTESLIKEEETAIEYFLSFYQYKEH